MGRWLPVFVGVWLQGGRDVTVEGERNTSVPGLAVTPRHKCPGVFSTDRYVVTHIASGMTCTEGRYGYPHAQARELLLKFGEISPLWDYRDPRRVMTDAVLQAAMDLRESAVPDEEW